MDGVLKPIIQHFENVEKIYEKTKSKNYPYVGIVQAPISLSSFSNVISVQEQIVNKVLSVDLKEHFAYKVIERLQYESKTTSLKLLFHLVKITLMDSR